MRCTNNKTLIHYRPDLDVRVYEYDIGFGLMISVDGKFNNLMFDKSTQLFYITIETFTIYESSRVLIENIDEYYDFSNYSLFNYISLYDLSYIQRYFHTISSLTYYNIDDETFSKCEKLFETNSKLAIKLLSKYAIDYDSD